jgi:hypothetical protein
MEALQASLYLLEKEFLMSIVVFGLTFTIYLSFVIQSLIKRSEQIVCELSILRICSCKVDHVKTRLENFGVVLNFKRSEIVFIQKSSVIGVLNIWDNLLEELKIFGDMRSFFEGSSSKVDAFLFVILRGFQEKLVGKVLVSVNHDPRVFQNLFYDVRYSLSVNFVKSFRELYQFQVKIVILEVEVSSSVFDQIENLSVDLWHRDAIVGDRASTFELLQDFLFVISMTTHLKAKGHHSVNCKSVIPRHSLFKAWNRKRNEAIFMPWEVTAVWFIFRVSHVLENVLLISLKCGNHTSEIEADKGVKNVSTFFVVVLEDLLAKDFNNLTVH